MKQNDLISNVPDVTLRAGGELPNLEKTDFRKQPYRFRYLYAYWLAGVRRSVTDSLKETANTVRTEDTVSVCAYGLLFSLTLTLKTVCESGLTSLSVSAGSVGDRITVCISTDVPDSLLPYKPKKFTPDVRLPGFSKEINEMLYRLAELSGFGITVSAGAKRLNIRFVLNRYSSSTFSVYATSSEVFDGYMLDADDFYNEYRKIPD